MKSSTQPQLKLVQEPEEVTAPDGSMLVTPEQLRRLGHGDVKRGRRYLRMLLADEQPERIHRGPTARPLNVEVAGPGDETAALAFLVEQISAVDQHAPLSADQILGQIERGTRQLGGIVGIVRQNGKIIACTVLVPAQPAHSKTWYLHEVFNEVHAQHRRGHLGRDLMNFGFWCADEWTTRSGFPIYYVAFVNYPHRVKERIRFYRRYMNQIGATFIYPTPPSTGA